MALPNLDHMGVSSIHTERQAPISLQDNLLWRNEYLCNGENQRETYSTPILGLVRVDDGGWYNLDVWLICKLRMVLLELAVLERGPGSAVLDLHDSGLCITGTFRE